MNSWLFVYGTLRRDISEKSTLLEPYAVYSGQAFMAGRLYEVAGYPGAVESQAADERVFGELYQLIRPSDGLAVLDEYEECSEAFARPHEYVRKRVLVWLESGATLAAWCYVYNLDVQGLQRISSGDYASFK
jgi:gamma-glutamylcyclotransferase (GGCT)/AIG2-like uncharacterized protein YtfP